MTGVRELVLTALTAQNGLTKEELLDLIAGDIGKSPGRSLGQALRHMAAEQTITSKAGRYYLTTKQSPIVSTEPTNGSARVALADYQKGRAVRQVGVYSSPTEYDNVAQVWVKAGEWVKLPLWGDLRICIGPGIPRWSVNQETNRGIICVRIVQSNGEAHDIPTDPRNPITIAPAKDM